MNFGGIVLIISIFINILLGVLYLFTYKNNANIYYWILACTILLLTIMTILYTIKADKPAVLVLKGEEEFMLKENFEFGTFTKLNDFYANMFATKEKREEKDSTAGLSCPFHEAHPYTCVWKNKGKAVTNCGKMDECKGLYKYTDRDGNEYYVGLGDQTKYNYSLK